MTKKKEKVTTNDKAWVRIRCPKDKATVCPYDRKVSSSYDDKNKCWIPCNHCFVGKKVISDIPELWRMVDVKETLAKNIEELKQSRNQYKIVDTLHKLRNLTTSSTVKVVLRCPVNKKHKMWRASVYNIYQNGSGCPTCHRISSRLERIFASEIRSLGFKCEAPIKVDSTNYTEGNSYQVDIYAKLGRTVVLIEFDGDNWHSKENVRKVEIDKAKNIAIPKDYPRALFFRVRVNHLSNRKRKTISITPLTELTAKDLILSIDDVKSGKMTYEDVRNSCLDIMAHLLRHLKGLEMSPGIKLVSKLVRYIEGGDLRRKKTAMKILLNKD